MAFDYVDLKKAKAQKGLRMAVVRSVPSPWSESAKGILYVKSLDWSAVSHVPGDPELRSWTKRNSAPVLMNDKEKPRSSWMEILMFAESLQPTPSLIPDDANQRALMFRLAHELLGEGGLCWSRRLQIVDVGMKLEGAPRKHAEYIGSKYGYETNQVDRINKRVIELLDLFASQLDARGDGDYYFGSTLTALDIYSAAAMALFAPLPNEVCSMNPSVRAGFELIDPDTKAALRTNLMAHRDMIYDRHLELPLRL